jgi:hypothetical protein
MLIGPCAVTRSHKDGCFQAHLGAVKAALPLSHLEKRIGPWRTIWAVSLLSLDLRTQGLPPGCPKIRSIRRFRGLDMGEAHSYPMRALPPLSTTEALRQ